MPIEFQVLSLRIQIQERLPEEYSEQIRLQQLLELGEKWVRSMAVLEQEQRRCKAFVDWHRNTQEKDFTVGKPVLVFQTRMGEMPVSAFKIPLDKFVLDSGSGKRHIFNRYGSRRRTTPESEQVSIKTLLCTHATKSFPRRTRGGRKFRAITTKANMYYSVTINIVPYRYL